MLTEDIIEVKKNKKKYKMGYSPETLSYRHKVKDIYEAEKKDTKADTKEPSKKEKKVRRDPRYQQMINKAKAEYGYIKDEDDAVRRWLQDTGYADHQHNKRQEKEIDNLKKSVADLQDELHELKNTLKQKRRATDKLTYSNR
tara:strand:+ start:289 stop:714 length:426 start_codon:yes stop_codon:yes gene_type:complete